MNQQLRSTTHVVNKVVGEDEICPVCLALCRVVNKKGVGGLTSEDYLEEHKAPHSGPNMCEGSKTTGFGRAKGKMLPCNHKKHSFERDGDYCPRCSTNMKK